MPEEQTYSGLNKGLNLWGWAASVNMEQGEALDSRDVLYRMDGSLTKHWGWERVTNAAFAARPLALRSFNYKGKNNNDAVNPVRPGNLGIAEAAGAAAFTRRNIFYSGALALTETQCLRWEPATEAWVNVALPAGVLIDIRAKPDILFIQNNLYIVGWADHNLRYDPVDEALYEWGWDTVPANAGHTGLQAGGTLIANSVYRYRVSWVDMYTGEESELSAEYLATTTAANRTVLLDNFIAYAGIRHFVDLGFLTNPDVGLAVYRTDPAGHAYYFLALVPPGLVAGTVTDNGLFTDTSLKAEVANYEDMPVLDGMCQYKSMIFGFSWAVPPVPGDVGRQAQLQGNSARVYYNDFKAEKSFIERWDVRNYKEVPLDDGEVLTSIKDAMQVVFLSSNTNCYGVVVTPNYQTGRITFNIQPMNWSVGCIGPKAALYIDGWLYFISDRGPYRWQPGTLKPQFIGKNVAPMFIDPETGLCQMTEGLRLESEVYYDQDADVIRWIFPCGPTPTLNRHLTYPPEGEHFGLKYWQGWSFCSTLAQCFDFGNAYHGLIGGLPATPFDVRARLAFGDNLGFVCQYEPNSIRGGLEAGIPVTGVGQVASTVNVLVTLGGLPVAGDGLDGLRLEVIHVDGTINVRVIVANTATDITPDVPFSQEPDGGTWYVGGIPFLWRSWVDHMGDPSAHKDLFHLHLGFNREFPAAGRVTDVNVAAADEWPLVSARTETVDLSRYRAKLMINRTGRFFTYEVANSRPDERFLLTWLKTEWKKLAGRL